MNINRCKLTSNFEINFVEKEDEAKQHVLTAFQSTIKYVINIGDKAEFQLEDEILDLEYVDVVFNKKKIITSILEH